MNSRRTPSPRSISNAQFAPAMGRPRRDDPSRRVSKRSNTESAALADIGQRHADACQKPIAATAFPSSRSRFRLLAQESGARCGAACSRQTPHTRPRRSVTVANRRGRCAIYCVQLVSNIVDNAIKFTSEGGVTVRHRPGRARRLDRGGVIPGPACPMRSSRIIFERFYVRPKARLARCAGHRIGPGHRAFDRCVVHGGEITAQARALRRGVSCGAFSKDSRHPHPVFMKQALLLLSFLM